MLALSLAEAAPIIRELNNNTWRIITSDALDSWLTPDEPNMPCEYEVVLAYTEGDKLTLGFSDRMKLGRLICIELPTFEIDDQTINIHGRGYRLDAPTDVADKMRTEANTITLHLVRRFRSPASLRASRLLTNQLGNLFYNCHIIPCGDDMPGTFDIWSREGRKGTFTVAADLDNPNRLTLQLDLT